MAATESGESPQGGGPAASVTPMDRVRWARVIAEMRANRPRAKTWKQIASATGLPERTCQRIHAQFMVSGDVDAPADRWKLVERRFDEIRVVMEEASNTYEAAPPGSSVRIGALKLFNQASADIIDIASQVGYLPRNLGALSAEREMQGMFRRFAEVLRRHNASEEMLADVLGLAEMELGRVSTVDGHALPPAA